MESEVPVCCKNPRPRLDVLGRLVCFNCGSARPDLDE